MIDDTLAHERRIEYEMVMEGRAAIRTVEQLLENNARMYDEWEQQEWMGDTHQRCRAVYPEVIHRVFTRVLDELPNVFVSKWPTLLHPTESGYCIPLAVQTMRVPVSMTTAVTDAAAVDILSAALENEIKLALRSPLVLYIYVPLSVNIFAQKFNLPDGGSQMFGGLCTRFAFTEFV